MIHHPAVWKLVRVRHMEPAKMLIDSAGVSRYNICKVYAFKRQTWHCLQHQSSRRQGKYEDV